MRVIQVIILVLALTWCASGQRVRFSGAIFDSTGAVVVSATIEARSEKGQHTAAKSNGEGKFEIELQPGLYEIDVSAPGFLTVQYSEYLVVISPSGMKMDFVMFGGKWHEPCGYSGADCLPARSLIKSYQIKYTPKLQEIRDEFSPETKPKNL